MKIPAILIASLIATPALAGLSSDTELLMEKVAELSFAKGYCDFEFSVQAYETMAVVGNIMTAEGVTEEESLAVAERIGAETQDLAYSMSHEEFCLMANIGYPGFFK